MTKTCRNRNRRTGQFTARKSKGTVQSCFTRGQPSRRGARAAQADHPAYTAMLAVAKNPRYLRSFKTDLTKHDRAALRKVKRNEPFVWLLGESGTHIFFPARPAPWNRGMNASAWLLPHLAASFEGGYLGWFTWNGYELKPTTQTRAAAFATANEPALGKGARAPQRHDNVGGDLSVCRQRIAPRKGADYGADPIGDGLFRMVPSGDVVNLAESRHRLR